MPELKTTLYHLEGATTVTIDALINDTGALVVEGQDIGEAPRAAFDEDDYEYWLTVAAEDKDALLLALLAKLYSGNGMVVTELRRLLREAGIPHTFTTF